MKALRSLFVAALLVAACVSPVPSPTALVATMSPEPSPGSTPSASPSPPLVTVRCVPEGAALPSPFDADPCPDALGAATAAVAPTGLPIRRIALEPGPFGCAGPWPGVGSPVICLDALVIAGTHMHGWVAFIGSDKVAAVELSRPYPTSDPGYPAGSPWTARVVTVAIPPAGWVMP